MNNIFLRYNQIANLPTEYQQAVRDLGDFYQQLPYDSDFTEIETTDLDQAFDQLPADTDWVVVVSYGHCTQNRNMYTELINKAIYLDVPLIGHIMNFSDQYPHLHSQIFVVDYKAWVRVGFPKWNYSGEAKTFTSVAIEASVENFHDDYTPKWITSGKGTKEYTVKEMQTGAEVIRAFVEAGYSLYNVPQRQRDEKFHLYPDQDWAEFHDFLSGEEYTGGNAAQRHYANLIGHLSNQVQRQYYVLNTEPLTIAPTKNKINHYAGVASGIKLFCTMVKNGFDADTAVTVFDFSDIAVKFQQHLLANWDGRFDHYQMVCKQFEDATPGHYPCLPSGEWADTYNYTLRELNLTKDEFAEQWIQYTKLKHRFEKINLYDADDQVRLVAICQQYANSYLWVSNAYYMEYSLIKLGKNKLKSIRDNLFSLLADASVVLDINDFWNQGLVTFV